MGCGKAEGFVVSGVVGVNYPPLIFVGNGGGTRRFGILVLGMWYVIAPGVDLR